ncbi:MAG: hypothetical protein QW614_05790 [Candidatus Caldarchaeum sp.]|uniref:Hsp20/alpha crystallin family protein n=1 Tax=Caldiarchaeum subterraneum TaxID=311458 RepID=A0A7C5L6Y8_CALS0
MSRKPQAEGQQLFGFLLLALVVVAVLSFMLRLQAGLLGLVLGGLAVGLAVYWIKALQQSTLSAPWDDFLLEIRHEGDVVDLTAQVPGPESKVRVELLGRKLVLIGGMGFKRTVKLPFEAILRELKYVNGILNAKLVKRTAVPTTS